MHRGYIKIWRKVKDSGLLQMHGTLALFMHMVMEATHVPIKIGTSYGVIQLEAGQFITGRHKLSEAVNLTEQKVRTCLDYLHELNIITSAPTNKFTIYTIVNYKQYQEIENEINQQDNQQSTNNQPTDNQQITTKQTHKHINTKEQYSSEFVNFWETWPSHFRKAAKTNCWKVWKNRKLDEIAPTIIAHVKYCKGNGVWKDEQFIPAPLVYLNGSRWDGAEINNSTSGTQFSMEEFMRSKT